MFGHQDQTEARVGRTFWVAYVHACGLLRRLYLIRFNPELEDRYVLAANVIFFRTVEACVGCELVRLRSATGICNPAWIGWSGPRSHAA